MRNREMILREISSLRADMNMAIARIEALEIANAQAVQVASMRAEAADAQAIYTAMMNDTLLEV